MDIPETKYARSGDLQIAYQVFGEGPRDLVVVAGFATHIELGWESPQWRRFTERLASFARVIIFDKRGTGLSDPVVNVATLEERIDDLRAVMDAAGSEHAIVFGMSEGAPMSILFAAMHPSRVDALILHGAMARTTEAPDYPFAPPVDAIRESMALIAPYIYEGASVEIFQPSLQDDPDARAAAGKYLRSAASPSMMRQIAEMFLDIDVRPILPSVRVPTMVMHRRGDRAVSFHAGRWLSEQIPGARFVELAGIDHLPPWGDQEAVLDEIQEFVTGSRGSPHPDRVVATLMFTDIVGSTERASSAGDRIWRELLDQHGSDVRAELERFGGREVKTLGDGFLAVFDGPARAIRCAVAISQATGKRGMPVRIGLHTGECETMGDDVGGIAVNIASRVSALAEGGEVLVSRTVKDLVAGSGIAFKDRGAHTLKGVPDEWQLFAVESST